MSEIIITTTVDARGLSCPLPIVKTKKAMDTMQSGQVLELLSTDKGSRKDVKAWADNGGHALLDLQEEAGVFRFHIQKG